MGQLNGIESETIDPFLIFLHKKGDMNIMSPLVVKPFFGLSAGITHKAGSKLSS